MKRHLTSMIALILVLALTATTTRMALTPATARAEEVPASEYDVRVGEGWVHRHPDGTWEVTAPLPEGASIQGDALVLNGVDMEDSIEAGGPLTVTLQGENRATTVNSSDDLAFRGSGSLALRGDRGGFGINTMGRVEIEDCAITVSAEDVAHAAGGIWAGRDLAIRHAKLHLDHTGMNEPNIFVLSGTATIEDSEVILDSPDGEGFGFMVPAEGMEDAQEDDLVVVRNSTLHISCSSVAIYERGNMRVENSDLSLVSTSDIDGFTGFNSYDSAQRYAFTMKDSQLFASHEMEGRTGVALGFYNAIVNIENSRITTKGSIDAMNLTAVDTSFDVEIDEPQGGGTALLVSEEANLEHCSLRLDAPAGTGFRNTYGAAFDNCTLDVHADGNGLQVDRGDLILSRSNANIRAGQAGLWAGEYSAISLLGSDTAITAKGGIFGARASVSILGGDTRIDSTEAAIVVESTSEQPEDAISLGASMIVEGNYSLEGTPQGNTWLYTFGDRSNLYWTDRDESLPYDQFAIAAENAAKALSLHGNGQVEGQIRASRDQLSVGMLANITASVISGADRAELAFTIPDALELLPDSVTMNGAPIESDFTDGVLSFTTDQADGTTRFSAYVVGEGECTITGVAVTEAGGERRETALSSCVLEATSFTMGLPTRTGRRTLQASGSAIPGSAITFYDNGARAGEAKASLAGAFSGEINLNGTGETHEIAATVTAPSGRSIKTAGQSLRYDSTCAEIKTLIMRNLIHGITDDILVEEVTTLDYAAGDVQKPSYAFWPEYPTITFEAEFINCTDPLGMGSVSVVTTDHSGSETRVPLSYDAETELWTGSADFTDFTMPERVRVEYTGGNFGAISLCGTEIPCRQEVDGTLRMGDGNDAILVRVGENTATFTDLEGNGLSLALEPDGRLTLDSTEGVRLVDADLVGTRVLLSNGKKSVLFDREDGGLVVSAPEGGQSLRLSDDGTLLEVDDGSGTPTRYLTEALSDVIEYPDGSTETWRASEDGASRSYTARDGSVLNYQYDDQGRLVSVTGDSVSLTAQYDEDESVFVDENGGITQIAYTPEGSVSRITYPDGLSVGYAYDAQGRLQSVTDPMGWTTRYAYGEDGRLLSVSDDSGTIAEYAYGEGGAVSARRLGNGARTDYADDAQARAYSIVNTLPDGAELSRQTTTFTEDGLAAAQTGTAGDWSFGYDRDGQLTSVTNGDGAVMEYAYTTSGTLASRSAGGVQTEYASNALNQITAVGSDAYEYDDSGRLVREVTTEGESTYEWDAFGRLVRHSAADGTVTEYAYDVFGNRSAVTVNGETTRYIWNPCAVPQVIGAILPDGGYVRYVQGAGLEARVDESGAAYYMYDALGSVTALLDDEGQVLNRYAYDPEGRTLDAHEAVDNPFRYAGQFGVMTDGNGLYYMRERYVSEALGAFLSPDPAGQSYDANLYRYADNNRVQKADVTGLGGHWVVKRRWVKDARTYFLPASATDYRPTLSPYHQDSVLREWNRLFAARLREGLNLWAETPTLPYISFDLIDDMNEIMWSYDDWLEGYEDMLDPMRVIFRPIQDLYGGVNNFKTLASTLMTIGSVAKMGVIPWILLGYAAAINVPYIPQMFICLAILTMKGYNEFANDVNHVLYRLDDLRNDLLDDALQGYILASEAVMDTAGILADTLRQLAEAAEEAADAGVDELSRLLDDAASRLEERASTAFDQAAEHLPEELRQPFRDGFDRLMELAGEVLEVERELLLPNLHALPETDGPGFNSASRGNADAGQQDAAMNSSYDLPDVVLDDPGALPDGFDSSPIIIDGDRTVSELVYVDGQWGYWVTEEYWRLVEDWIWVEAPDPDDPPAQPPKPEYVSPGHDVDPHADPSGYVYEAVPANRLPNVTATLYYKETLETPDEEAVLWDAASYDQVNPQQTGVNGEYGWMVNPGWYRVVYAGEGYEPAQSTWLPVPPVQTEVNVGLVSPQPPVMTEAAAYDSGTVSFAFDRYVKVDSLTNEGTVAVLRADGSPVPGYVRCLNAARSGDAGLCGTLFEFELWEPISAGESLILRVEGAIGYNDLPAAAEERTLSAIRRVGSVTGVEAERAMQGDRLALEYQVCDVYGEPMAGCALAISLPSSSLRTVGEISECVTDGDGRASLTVECARPGTGIVVVSDPASRRSATTRVNVDSLSDVPQAYSQAMADSRAWLSDLKATWTDGEREDEAIASRYAETFARQSDRARSLLQSAEHSKEIEQALDQLDEWDASVKQLLFDSINRYISPEVLSDISQILYERGRLFYRYGE